MRARLAGKLAGLVRNQFLRDTGALQVGALLVSGGNFLSAVGLAYLLGAARQGEFYVAVSLYSSLWYLVNLGLVQVTVSKVSAALGAQDRDEACSWLAYLLKAYALLGAAVGGVAHLVLPWVATDLVDARAEVGAYAALLAFTPLLDLPRVVAGAALQATRRMIPLAQTDNAFELVRVYLVLLGALLTGDLRGPVLGSLAASGLGSVLAVALYTRECRRVRELVPGPGEILAHVRGVPLRKGLAVGLRLGAAQNLSAYGTQILPTLLLQRFGSSEWVAYLRIGQRIMNVPLMLMQAISRTALPALSKLAGVKDLRELCRTYFRTSLFSGLTIGGGLLAFLPFLPWVLELALPEAYGAPILTICLILVPGYLVIAFSSANDTFYLVTGTLRVAILLSVAGALVNLPLMAFLAWRWPTTGVAWALTLSMLWSLVHPAYVWSWYRRNVVRAGGAPAPLEAG